MLSGVLFSGICLSFLCARFLSAWGSSTWGIAWRVGALRRSLAKAAFDEHGFGLAREVVIEEGRVSAL